MCRCLGVCLFMCLIVCLIVCLGVCVCKRLCWRFLDGGGLCVCATLSGVCVCVRVVSCRSAAAACTPCGRPEGIRLDERQLESRKGEQQLEREDVEPLELLDGGKQMAACVQGGEPMCCLMWEANEPRRGSWCREGAQPRAASVREVHAAF